MPIKGMIIAVSLVALVAIAVIVTYNKKRS
jgi:hypothetical protein